MAAVSIRGLGDEVKERLRVRAARNGRSLEAEVRLILAEAVRRSDEHHLGRRILAAFGDDGVDLEVPERASVARGPDFS